jgi:hypothetical protein
MSTIGPIEVHQALDGLTFPATREQILAHLDQSENAALIRSRIEDMPEGEYQDIDEVDSALSDESY